MFKMSIHPLQAVVAALALSMLGHAAFAQPTAPGQSDVQQKAQQIQSQLIEIQRNTLDENPELREQGEALEALITETMKEQGASPEEDAERLQELQQQAQDPDMEQEKRQQMAAEFQKIQQDLIRARQRAAENEEVQAEQAEFQTAMLEAMQEQNPRTEELLAEMREIQLQQQRQLQQQIEQQQQQQQQQPSQ